MDRSDLELVLAIRQHGSLSSAARALHVTPPVVTKRLAALESLLRVQLFQRTTRKVSPTADGDALCEHAQTLVRGFQQAEAELRERQSEPTGLIRLAATFGFGRLWVGPAVAEFQQRYPRLQIQLHLVEQHGQQAGRGVGHDVEAVARGVAVRQLARDRADGRAHRPANAASCAFGSDDRGGDRDSQPRRRAADRGSVSNAGDP